MPTGPATAPSKHDNNTIILPISQDQYGEIVPSPEKMRDWIDEMYHQHPEIFPVGFERGYRFHDDRTGDKLGIRLRRITLRNGKHWTIQPSFVMPYMTALTEDIENALLLRKWSVPYWALVKIFGKDDNFWHRIEIRFGRYSIVGTTVKTVDIPTDLLADEHHEKNNGEKTYIATTVGGGCVLGAEVCMSPATDDLKKAYGVFKEEALTVDPEYAPETVNTDGWAGTMGAWRALFVNVVLIRCFLHA